MEASAENDPYENLGHRTIFQEIVNNTSLPPKEKSTQRLVQEAGGMITGGGESTTQVLTSTTFFLAANPDKLQRLRKELKSVTPDTATGSLSLRQLEKLPYLVCNPQCCILTRTDRLLKTAVVKEGLRCVISLLLKVVLCLVTKFLPEDFVLVNLLGNNVSLLTAPFFTRNGKSPLE